MASHHRTRIYTDGSFSQKSKLGGWAFVVYQDGHLHHEESGALPDGQTMQASELWAMGMALKWACENPDLWPGGVKLITDSRYIFKGITRWMHDWKRRGWRKSDGDPISHPKIWERLYERSQQIEPKPAFKHVQSHREQGSKFSLDIEGNNRADELAGQARKTAEAAKSVAVAFGGAIA